MKTFKVRCSDTGKVFDIYPLNYLVPMQQQKPKVPYVIVVDPHTTGKKAKEEAAFMVEKIIKNALRYPSLEKFASVHMEFANLEDRAEFWDDLVRYGLAEMVTKKKPAEPKPVSIEQAIEESDGN